VKNKTKIFKVRKAPKFYKILKIFKINYYSMKTNKKLTLKQLKEELENLKTSKASKLKPSTSTDAHGGIGHDIKNSYINRMYMKSTLITLWILSWIITLGKRIPMVRYLISVLSIWYGRTTWWKILVRIFTISRKIFIIINAIIGVYAVFKLSGFQVGLAYSHFGLIGQTYLDILTNFTKRIFEWFLDLLGYDVGPKKPTGPRYKDAWSYWNPNHSNEAWYDQAKRANPLNNISNISKDWLPGINIRVDTTPWYRDLSTWLWISGIISFLGISYIGYKFLFDPTFIASIPSINKTGPTPPIDPDNLGSPNIKLDKGKAKELFDDLNSPGPSVGEMAIRGVKTVSKGLILGTKMLNPFYWITSNEDWNLAKEDFRYQQTSDRYNSRYYPYTSDHPYDPWFIRLKYRIFGETQAEYMTRQRKIVTALDKMHARIRTAEAITSPTGSVASLGIGVSNFPGSPYLNDVALASSSVIVDEKLSNIPSTPIKDPSVLSNVNSQSESPGWGTIVTRIVNRNHPSAGVNPSLPIPEIGGIPSDWSNQKALSSYNEQGTLIPMVVEANPVTSSLPQTSTPATVIVEPVVAEPVTVNTTTATGAIGRKPFLLSEPNPFPFKKTVEQSIPVEMTSTGEIVTTIGPTSETTLTAINSPPDLSEDLDSTPKNLTIKKPEFLSDSDSDSDSDKEEEEYEQEDL
jgi:hypothetical protein